MGSLSIWHWLIVLLVVVLIFGTKKLRNMGGDVGGAIKEFKSSMADAKVSNSTEAETNSALTDDTVILPTKAPAKRKAPAKTTTTKATSAKATASKTTTKSTVAKKPAASKVATANKTTTKKPASKATTKPKASA